MVEESDTRKVLVTRDNSVATVTLNRPDRHNGLTAEMKDQLVEALADVADDTSVRAVVLTGAGKAFCVGQDLAEHAEALNADAGTAFDTIAAHYNPIVTALATMPKPVIAAINGACVGAGLGFALACDLRMASAGVKFGTAFTAIGLTCDSGLSASLVRAVGAARAGELVLLGETFTAAQALEWGLVGRVVEPEELAAMAGELAAKLAAGPTAAYAEAKQALARAHQPPLDDVLRAEGAAQARLGLTHDHRSAVDAFLAKQQPQFTGE
ncbi:MAG: enoyl-CoA hydratase [Actinophytocola sp.]|nr:enoyl-CoA hydratase [Actinophytocola sp.]